MGSVKVLVLIIVLTMCVASHASFLSDPPAVVTCGSGSADFFKDLNGYFKYGAADGQADILYDGESGSWDFGGLTGCPGSYTSAVVTFSLSADDHDTPPVSAYSEDIFVNGALVFSGTEPLQHGTPYNGQFANWQLFSFTTTDLSTPFTVAIHNTSNGTEGWIGIDSIRVDLASAAVPEPSSLLLLGSGFAGLLGAWRRKIKL